MAAITFVGGTINSELTVVGNYVKREIKVLTKKDPLSVWVFASKGSAAEKELSVAEMEEMMVIVGQFRSPIRDRDNENKIVAITAARASNIAALKTLNLVFILGSLGRETEVKDINNGKSKVCNRAIFTGAAFKNLNDLLAEPTTELDDEYGLPPSLMDKGTVIMSTAWDKNAEVFSSLETFTPVVGIGTLHGSKVAAKAAPIADRTYFSLRLSMLYGLPIMESQGAGITTGADGEQRIAGNVADFSSLENDELDM